jgi:tyrosinase
MRFFDITALALISGAGAFKITEHDKLAALGLANVGIDVAQNGYPNPGQCTLKNVRVRREWYDIQTPRSKYT